MQVRPNRWRALPTAILIVGCILLGAVTARAEGPHASASTAPSSAAAAR